MLELKDLPYTDPQELADFAAFQHYCAMSFGEGGSLEDATRWEAAAVKNYKAAQELARLKGMPLPVRPTQRKK